MHKVANALKQRLHPQHGTRPETFPPVPTLPTTSFTDVDLYRYRQQRGVNLGPHPFLVYCLVTRSIDQFVEQALGSFWSGGSQMRLSVPPMVPHKAISTLRAAPTPKKCSSSIGTLGLPRRTGRGLLTEDSIQSACRYVLFLPQLSISRPAVRPACHDMCRNASTASGKDLRRAFRDGGPMFGTARHDARVVAVLSFEV